MYYLLDSSPRTLWCINYKHFPNSSPPACILVICNVTLRVLLSRGEVYFPSVLFRLISWLYLENRIWLKWQCASSESCTLPLSLGILIHHENNPRLAWWRLKEHLESRWVIRAEAILHQPAPNWPANQRCPNKPSWDKPRWKSPWWAQPKVTAELWTK